MALITSAKGNDGQVELHDDRIIIKRKGIIALFMHGLKGDKSIPLASISSVELKHSSFLSLGYIEFIFSGSAGSRKENKIIFNKKQQPQFLKIKEKTFELMNQRNNAPQQ